jgi:predicted kinase
MEAVIFIGIQGTGKSTFYRERFFTTHMRINLDMLRTRRREEILIRACLEAGQRFVIDNTNTTIVARAKYITAARQAHFQVVGYYFQSSLSEALKRNRQRTGKERIPEAGIRAAHSRLEIPTITEGFDKLCYVRIDDENRFVIEDWPGKL